MSKEVTFNEKNGELNLYDVYRFTVDDYKIVYAKDIQDKELKRFYKRFYKKLPDHPDEASDFFLFTYKKDWGWVDVYFICSHFECNTSDYLSKLFKISKRVEQQVKSHTEVIYLSSPYEVLILGWLNVLGDLKNYFKKRK